MSNNHVGLIAKYPELGKVKTRLAKTVGENTALLIYKKLLKNCLINCAPTDNSYGLTVFLTPEKKLEDFQKYYFNSKNVQPQIGNELGGKMVNALTFLKDNYDAEHMILIGSDIPELNADTIHQGLNMLKKTDIILGPTTDGGYYLIGMNKVHRELFDSIKYGTDTVLKETLAKIKRNNLSYNLLPELADLDSIVDLEHFPDYKRLLQ